jgi:acetyl esterase/lipase
MNAHLWLIDTASAGKRRIIMGDSAPAGAVLMCPWVELECCTQRPSRESPVLFSPALARRFGRAYLGGQPATIPRSPRCRPTWPGCCRCSSTRPRVIRCCRRPQLLARHSKQCGVETKLTIYPCQPVGSPHSME